MTIDHNDSRGVWTIILAAGASTRFGGIKALAPWVDGTFLTRALAVARAFTGDRTLVVTGAHRAEIAVAAAAENANIVFNPSWEKGMGTSLACGVAEVLRRTPDTRAIALMLVDQPYVETAHLVALLVSSTANGLCTLTGDGETQGPPAVITQKYFELAMSLTSDSGIKRHIGNFNEVLAPEALQDMDFFKEPR